MYNYHKDRMINNVLCLQKHNGIQARKVIRNYQVPDYKVPDYQVNAGSLS